ncbi:MAG: cytochrome c oxidase subunit II [Solirubrobacterales bacterium]|nr:cytochrome c oxidase subunit II [Solirubrobacterales bacterium]
MGVLGAFAMLAAGCSKQSILSTRSPQAHNIMLLWWWMFGVATVVFLGAAGMLVLAWFRRDSPGLPLIGERENFTEGMVLLFGIAIPIVVLVALFAVSDVYLVKQTSPPNPRSTALTINVIGHQFWWEVRYSGTNAVTANEIHIPVDTRVNVVTTTADVIHSFWVPALNRKIDMIPGRRNRVLLYASRAGTYRGQCSQFCGLQHAHMAMYVFAQQPAAFRAWLSNMASTARTPGSTEARTGQQLFMSSQCASCHRIAGTAAQATVGPDLTHLATRTTLASATIPNTPAWLASWISNPQAIKPGNRMPDLGLSTSTVNAIVAYLETLR